MSASTARTRPLPTETHRLRPENTTVHLTMRHLFGLQRVTGTVQLLDGRLWLGPDGELEGVEADLDAASFESGSKARDGIVLSAKFLDVGRHERLTFRSDEVTTTGDGVWLVRGQLSAHGQGAPVELTVRPDPRTGVGSDGLGAVVTGRVDRYAHGVTAARGLASRFLQLRITTEAQPVSVPSLAARTLESAGTADSATVPAAEEGI